MWIGCCVFRRVYIDPDVFLDILRNGRIVRLGERLDPVRTQRHGAPDRGAVVEQAMDDGHVLHVRRVIFHLTATHRALGKRDGPAQQQAGDGRPG